MSAKKILMVIAPEKFRDEEFFEPKAVFEKAGCGITVASTKVTEAVGTLGGVQKTDAALSELSAKDFDAICISGGGGSRTYLWDDKHLHALINDFAADGKAIGAICISPVILAKAGVLDGKKSTVFPDDEAIDIMTKSGSDVDPKTNVVRDGKIVTANGPKVSAAFGEELLKLM